MNIASGMVGYPVEHLRLALLTSGLSQSMLVAVILLAFATRPRDPRFILGIFLALYGMTFVGELGVVTGFLFAVPHLILPVLIAPIFLGPVLYIYICSLVDGERRIDRTWLFQHAIAPAAATAVALTLIMAPAETLGALPQEEFEPGSVTDLIVIMIVVLVQFLTALITLIYLIKGYVKLYAHGIQIRSEFSNLERRTLGWLRFSLINLGLFWAATMFADWSGFSDRPSGSVILSVWELMIFYVMAVLGIRQRVIFGAPPPGSAALEIPVPSNTDEIAETVDPGEAGERRGKQTSKYAKSGLTQQDMTRISQKIRLALERDRIYKNSDLSLTQLSRHIGVQPPYVSQTLTQVIGTNFYDFIAQARIGAAKQLLADAANSDSILGIAISVGFNSKSTFNAAFKRVCGTTPSEWRRRAVPENTAATG